MAQDRACAVPRPMSASPWAESFDNQLIARYRRYREVNHERLADPLLYEALSELCGRCRGSSQHSQWEKPKVPVHHANALARSSYQECPCRDACASVFHRHSADRMARVRSSVSSWIQDSHEILPSAVVTVRILPRAASVARGIISL